MAEHKWMGKHLGCTGEGCPHCPKLEAPENAAMLASMVLPEHRNELPPVLSTTYQGGQGTIVHKPKMTVDQMAEARKRCKEREKTQGIPCGATKPLSERKGDVPPVQTPQMIESRRARRGAIIQARQARQGGVTVAQQVRPEKTWACGVTAVPERGDGLLPATLASLHRAGFEGPTVFVDGCEDGAKFARSLFQRSPWYAGVRVVARLPPKVKVLGNWWLGLLELYLREPDRDFYAMFQDDVVAVKNLKAYLTLACVEERSYWNLHTFPTNQVLFPPDPGGHGGQKAGFFMSNQRGQAACGLVFTREGAMHLLSSRHLVDKAASDRRHKSLDGGVVTAFGKLGWHELVHNPSLVQHTGTRSVMGNAPHPLAPSYPGDDFDAMTLPIPHIQAVQL